MSPFGASDETPLELYHCKIRVSQTVDTGEKVSVDRGRVARHKFLSRPGQIWRGLLPEHL